MSELLSQSLSIQSLYGWFRTGKLWVNRRYQRKLVWTLEEKQKLIDSILNKYPIPAVLLAERSEYPGTYEIIDGLQRLHAVASFIEGAFSTQCGQSFNLSFFPTARTYSEAGLFIEATGDLLQASQVTTILDYTISVSMMRNANQDEINEVFDRINTYGHRLSDQERRQAGVQSDFSNMVREIACQLRGDVSDNILELPDMPSISIDLPRTAHGYEVKAEDVFWVQQGVLRSTDLRDSMDEQCIADISACIIGGQLIERSKAALDKVYTISSPESEQLETALSVYGAEKFAQEFKYCIEKIVAISENDSTKKLRDIVYNQQRSTNPFPSVFALIFISFYEIMISNKKTPSNYSALLNSLNNLSSRLDTTRRATKPDERRKNIDSIKGLIEPHFIERDPSPDIYDHHAATDIDAFIRRSEAELPYYELKQGILRLSDPPVIDDNVVKKVSKTICAMANNGQGRSGKILVGVADKESDAQRVRSIYDIQPRTVGNRYVVGVAREAKQLDLSNEEYFQKWKNELRTSGLSEPLLGEVLSSLDFNDYYGLGVLVISIPPQKSLSYVEDNVYWRDGDETVIADSPRKIAELAGRFPTS